MVKERPTIIVLFVPLNVGDHARHVHRAEELGRLPHLEAHVLWRLKYIGQAAHLDWNNKTENKTSFYVN